MPIRPGIEGEIFNIIFTEPMSKATIVWCDNLPVECTCESNRCVNEPQNKKQKPKKKEKK
jgi:hypothetical protein